MSEFRVEFTETIQHEITIEADSKEDAETKIRSMEYDPDETTQLCVSSVDIDGVYEI